jgi:hypothetical protein
MWKTLFGYKKPAAVVKAEREVAKAAYGELKY